jgi:probable F420-dependent oxidoreductase
MSGDLGRYGVFRRHSLLSPPLATTLERLGYGAIWVGGSPEGGLRVIEELLDATTTITVATGIVNIWTADAPTVAASYHRIEARHPGRFLLGVGVGHPEAISDYRHPYAAVVSYLDELDAADVPADRRVLAALGPRMLRLSADRSAGAHPYLTTPEHTRRAREILGPTALLAPEQHVVVNPDPASARAIGRPAVAQPYLGLSNYTSNLRTLGFDVAHGDPSAVAARLQQHLDAGADHVAVNLLTAPGADPVPGLSALAEVLFG